MQKTCCIFARLLFPIKRKKNIPLMAFQHASPHVFFWFRLCSATALVITHLSNRFTTPWIHQIFLSNHPPKMDEFTVYFFGVRKEDSPPFRNSHHQAYHGFLLRDSEKTFRNATIASLRCSGEHLKVEYFKSPKELPISKLGSLWKSRFYATKKTPPVNKIRFGTCFYAISSGEMDVFQT